ncbi:SIR2 family NAD-dependent protein deacylase [Hymenobacter ruricola]|uniref:SIR2 family protein n=1 Tax=Hymenobacter ruricola TaxID=2791023 RepID=A0ABS0I6A0_9BACT|nr:SIR2 family protein [Hymenobacter ruricola]MBF9222491.1 SIR2 family protein [Hymenobacter ruricola]
MVPFPDVSTLPDLNHLIYLRNRLWARKPIGRAAVMVGAGFSLNAKSKMAGGATFPLWREITGYMLDRLQPMLKPDERKKALDRAVSGSGSLTLALEFEATFGRSALDDLIVSIVPDHDHSPGPLHEALLSLPWADVFTTNYDTLLERTRPGEQGRYYDVVVQPSDLPNSTQPRIVKLHGSLPVTKPFIITEEDFRRYPRNFAPFVNTVQQSMMENDFVLLGFSGDDPNFLSWLGWVRDELTTLRPRVYLCGVLDISSAQRLVLRERGVTAIDLGPLFPEENYPDNKSQRNQDALAWLLYSLENGQGLELPLQWPYFPEPVIANRIKLPKGITPLNIITVDYAAEENYGLKNRRKVVEGVLEQGYSEAAQQELYTQIEGWKLTRKAYPGWLVLPRRNRPSLIKRTKPWHYTIVDWAATLPVDKQLLVLSELVWRLDRGMLVVEQEPEEELYKKIIADVPLPESPVQQEQWATIAFYFLKQLRHNYNHQAFHELLDKIEPLAQKQPRYGAWRCWQAALERLEHLDREEARRWLKKWPDMSNDPVWDLRRAGLWAEINELDMAERYADSALETALLQQPRGTIRIDMLSVEESARHLLTDIRSAKWWQGDDEPMKEDIWNITREELARHKLYTDYRCNAYADIEQVEELLKGPEPEFQLSIYESINPYTGSRIRTQTSGGGINISAYQPAFDILDSQEQRGHPFAIPGSSRKVIGLASRWLFGLHSSRALGAILRSGNDDLLAQLLDKAMLAAYDAAELLPLLDKALALLEQNFPAAGSGSKPHFTDRYKTQQIGIALRLVGRAAFRLDEPLRLRAIQIALGLWENWPTQLLKRENFYIKHEQYSDFTEGITSLMKSEEVAQHLAPLVGAAAEPQFASGAFESIPKILLPETRPGAPAFTRAIAVCLELLASSEQDEKQAALGRLMALQQLGWLTTGELAEFGQLLWDKVEDPDGLPSFDNWPALWTVLLLPAPPSIDLVVRLKKRLMTQAEAYRELTTKPAEKRNHGNPAFDRLLFNVTHATRPASGKLLVGKSSPREWIDWTKEEACVLFETLERMIRHQELTLRETLRTKRGEAFGYHPDEGFHYAGQFLREVVIPHVNADDQQLAARIHTCVTELIRYELPARSALPFLTPILGNTSSTATSIRLALVAPASAESVRDGAEALCRWAYAAFQDKLPALPEGLLQEFIIRLGMPGLPDLLAIVYWAADLVIAAPRIFWPNYAIQLGDALQALAECTQAPGWRERSMARSLVDKERLFQRPRIREQAARLAGQLTRLNQIEPVSEMHSIITVWEEVVEDDLLPEVRRAWQEGFSNPELVLNWHDSEPTP